MKKRILATAVLGFCVGIPAVANDPTKAFDVVLEGTRAAARGDLDGAVEIFGQCIDDQETDHEIKLACRTGRMRAWASQQRLELALDDADVLISAVEPTKDPFQIGNMRAMRGFILAEMGRTDEAIDDLEFAEASLQEPSQSHNEMLESLERRHPERAREMHENRNMTIRHVKEKLEELRRLKK